MKTHFYLAKDESGNFKGKLYAYSKKPEKKNKQWYSGKIKIAYIDRDCLFYNKLKPILSKIDPGQCIQVSCDLKVVK